MSQYKTENVTDYSPAVYDNEIDELSTGPAEQDQAPHMVIDEVCLIRYDGSESRVVIPPYVTSIKPNAFKECKTVREVIIPDSITVIPEGTFEKCTKLEMVKLPECLEMIGSSAFKDCINLTDMSLPSSVQKIGSDAFLNTDRLNYETLFEKPAISGKSIRISDSWFENEYRLVCERLTPKSDTIYNRGIFGVVYRFISKNLAMVIIVLLLLTACRIAIRLELISKSSPPEIESSEKDDKLYKNMAVRAVRDCLEYQPLSYSRIVELLIQGGYTEEEAHYGADHCGADWNEQALKRAGEYLEYSLFSYTRLVDFLGQYDGFSKEEAVYAADHCGADWNKQAVKKAEFTLENVSYSYTGLVDVLTDYGFTDDEAIYGADHCGADWNEQAAKAAKKYLNSSSGKSYEEVVAYLTEQAGFTYDEAVNGINSAVTQYMNDQN